jgi:tellurite resistance protein
METLAEVPRVSTSTGSTEDDSFVIEEGGISVRVSMSISSGESSAPRPRADVSPDSCWISAGQVVAIAGRTIPGGLLYVGSGLASVGNEWNPEPALIDPSLPIKWSNPDFQGTGLRYWPSYSSLSPESRAAYLEWLNDGRRNPETPIGYVFLFFYGLERRILADAETSIGARGELDEVLTEVDRLISIYGSNGSFSAYAGDFLSVGELLRRSLERLYERPIRPTTGRSAELPLWIRAAVGQLVADGKPIPPAWALAWLMNHPETHLRTPATRCSQEFQALFIRRYQAKYGDGMKLEPNKKRLKVEYRPASASFGRAIPVKHPDLPDVAAVTAPVQRLIELADAVTEDLEPYSRWIGKNPDDRGSLAAIALLPAELARDHTSEQAQALKAWASEILGESDRAIVPAEKLVWGWPCGMPGQPSKAECVLMAQFLETLGYGFEPDVRFGGTTLEAGNSIVVFRLPDGSPASLAPPYAAASLALRFGSAVAAADGVIAPEERRHLASQVESAPNLSTGERARLAAHLEWLLATPPSLAGLKKRVEDLGANRKADISRLLVAVSAADGHVSPDEVKTLEKLYKTLGLATDQLYSDIHAATSTVPPAAEPVTIRPADSSSRAFTIPSKPLERPKGIVLDASRIQAKLAETAAASALLSQIFAENPPPPPTPELKDASKSVAGLDALHSELVRQVASRASWSRIEIEAITSKLGLMTDGAIEAINEASFRTSDEALLDGDDPIEVNAAAAGGMLK